jgi:hypothetical protein
MNDDGLKVVFRIRATFVSAGLELESQRAFAVISIYGPKEAKDGIGGERVELDVRFLQQINKSEYLYQKLVELPIPGRSGPERRNVEGDPRFAKGISLVESPAAGGVGNADGKWVLNRST